jgi:hypothetical protein
MRERDWTDEFADAYPYVRMPYDAARDRGFFAFADSDEDRWRKARGLVSDGEQIWHDYAHDAIAFRLRRAENPDAANTR